MKSQKADIYNIQVQTIKYPSTINKKKHKIEYLSPTNCPITTLTNTLTDRYPGLQKIG